jgi:serine/threonine protein kinase
MASAEALQTYGRFRIESEAAHGGMATVYAARDLLTGNRVALKVLRETDGRSNDRFRQEAALLAELRHPGIVRFIEHGVAHSEEYLAMEWLEGETLEQRLRGGVLGVLDTLGLGERVLDALAVAHERGVIHRDLKPANLFLPGGSLAEVKLIDFGIARRGARRLTSTGSTLGTPMYMSPEQARGERTLDARSDVFSLGSVLVQCLTGHSPFEADTPIAVMARICVEPFDLQALLPQMPAPLVDLLARMLARRRELRPARAEDLAAEFSRLARTLPRLVNPW